MKKILLTLGTTTVIATPLATVVACGSSTTATTKTFEPSFDASAKELTIERTTFVNKSDFGTTTTETSIKSFLNDLHTVLFDDAYVTSEKVKLTKNGDETKTENITISNITFEPGTTSTNVNPTTLAEVKTLSWQAAKNAYINGKLMDLTTNENMTWQLFSKAKTTIVDDTAIRTALTAETFESTKTREQLEAVASETAISAEEANTKFGVNSIEFAKITAALGSDWEFVSLGYDTTESKLKLVYRHEEEESNKEIHLATQVSNIDDSSIRTILSGISIVSTKTLIELNAVAGTPATTASDALSRFGVNQTSYNAINQPLTGDWSFVNIDFDTTNNQIKVSYKHTTDTMNREAYLTTTTKPDDTSIKSVLETTNISSTKTIGQLISASGTVATSEADANTTFGINSTEFDKITTALTTDWEFVNIDFDTTNSKFKLAYKHTIANVSGEVHLGNISTAAEDDTSIRSALDAITINSTKTLTELTSAASTPATTEADTDTKFGINSTEFAKITTALTTDWEFVNIDFDTTNRNFELNYKHSNETDNREILLNGIFEIDHAAIVAELNKLIIWSSMRAIEIESGPNVPATTEEEANTKFGINSNQFIKIIDTLGGSGSKWSFISISYDATSYTPKFKLVYKHITDTSNRDLLIKGGFESGNIPYDIAEALKSITLNSTKTRVQAAAAGDVDPSDIINQFGLNSVEFAAFNKVFDDLFSPILKMWFNSANPNKLMFQYFLQNGAGTGAYLETTVNATFAP